MAEPEEGETAYDPWQWLGRRVAPGEWRRTCIFNCVTPCAEGCLPASHIGRGRTGLHASQHDQRFAYCLYVPRDYAEDETTIYPLVVIVHGSERAPQAYRDAFVEFAEEHGCIVLAPLFPNNIIEGGLELHNYKFIAFHDIRFDLLLLAMIEEVAGMYRIGAERFCLFGFSGGGQFAHRFFYLHPDRLLAVSIGAPGWVTLLDDERGWWVGTGDLEERFGIAPDIAAMQRVAVQTVAGGEDTETWDVQIPEGSRYWLPGANDAGRTRLERIAALADSYERHGITVRQEIVPGVGHEGFKVLEPVQAFFRDALKARAADSEEIP